MKRVVLAVAVIFGLIGGMVIVAKKSETPVAIKSSVTVHKTATCGCCANYVGYLRKNGYEVEVINHSTSDRLTDEKRKIGVPSSLDSCHTTVFNQEKYFVEGHIPLEAVEKMLASKPQFKGIGMPGMPSASPGMPGAKIEPFNISQVSTDGTTSSYMTI